MQDSNQGSDAAGIIKLNVQTFDLTAAHWEDIAPDPVSPTQLLRLQLSELWPGPWCMNRIPSLTLLHNWWLPGTAEIKRDSMIYLFYRVITSEIYELTLVGLPGRSHQNGRDRLSIPNNKQVWNWRKYICVIGLSHEAELKHNFVRIIRKACVRHPVPLWSLMLFVRWRDGRYLGKY